MIIYKCKMCGGNLKITEESKIATCEYCQTQQTIPATDDEKRANLFNRANHFRQNSEFDKAMGIYEHILEEDGSDAEAYWSIVLCKYGVEYVEDPVTKKQNPTVNRTQAQSILKDADYLMALEHADYAQKALYEKEAKEIDQIQRDILQIAQNEQPYDIFISYKEKASSGERTKSSVLAQDVYNQLTKEGYRVFFSRISLEDKVGQKYEPYIYSALNSAKVMLVIGTEKEEFIAPWVRNEWNRFLTMMREDTDKLLIPCFRDINIDDLPNEFQILQSQDMSKIGFEQDLVRGIEKICKNKKLDNKQYVSKEAVTADSLVARAFICLKDGDFKKAAGLLDQALNMNPYLSKAYLGRLMCTYQVKQQDDLVNVDYPLSKSKDYQHILEYGDSNIVNCCINYETNIIERIMDCKIQQIDSNIITYKSKIAKQKYNLNELTKEEKKNTSKKQQAYTTMQQTNQLCRVIGIGFIGITFLIAIFLYVSYKKNKAVSIIQYINSSSDTVPITVFVCFIMLLIGIILFVTSIKDYENGEIRDINIALQKYEIEKQRITKEIKNSTDELQKVENAKYITVNRKEEVIRHLLEYPREIVNIDDLI